MKRKKNVRLCLDSVNHRMAMAPIRLVRFGGFYWANHCHRWKSSRKVHIATVSCIFVYSVKIVFDSIFLYWCDGEITGSLDETEKKTFKVSTFLHEPTQSRATNLPVLSNSVDELLQILTVFGCWQNTTKLLIHQSNCLRCGEMILWQYEIDRID